MGIAKVQAVTGAGATIALSGVVAGNTLVLLSSFFRSTRTGAAAATPTDSAGGTWLAGVTPAAASFNGGANDVGVGIFVLENAAAGTHTATPENASTHHNTLLEFSGLALSGTRDASASGTSASTDHTSRTTGTTGSPAQDEELVLIVHAMAALFGVADVGYTDPVTGYTTEQKVVNDTSDLAMMHAWKLISAAAAQSATFAWTQHEAEMSSQAAILTLKAPSPPPAGPTNLMAQAIF
jgi:hypothetical protein